MLESHDFDPVLTCRIGERFSLVRRGRIGRIGKPLTRWLSTKSTYELLEILPRALEWLTFSNPTRPTLRKPAQQNPTSDGRFCPAGLQL